MGYDHKHDKQKKKKGVKPLIYNVVLTLLVISHTYLMYLIGMDWIQADYSTVLARQLTKYHGNITAENTIRDITSIVQTGDQHIAIYDLSMGYMYVANARKAGAQGPIYAYDRYEKFTFL